MNKYEKAIRYFEEHLAVLENHCKHGGEFAFEAREHTRTAIEALRKQVPRALYDFDSPYGRCPTCNDVCNGYQGHCDSCGQAVNSAATECVAHGCIGCVLHDINTSVCKHYADKVDEIKRIHEED